MKKDWLIPLCLFATGGLVWFFGVNLLSPSFLTFSDAAKFADVARNFILGNGFSASLAPFAPGRESQVGFFPIGTLPLPSLVIALVFRLFGIKDFLVILTSGFFYLAGAITLYFLGKKIFSQLVGFLAALAFIFDPAMLNYAMIGASEAFFIFELIFTSLMFLLRKRWSMILGFIALLAMYWTRQSAIIYIAGLIFFFILLNFRSTKAIIKAVISSLVVYFLVEAFLSKFSKGLFLYSPLALFLYGTAKFSPLSTSTEALRGGMVAVGFQLKPFLSKFFYNLYNFYKLLPQILSSYLASFYVLSIFRWEREREKIIFRGLVLFFVLATFFAAAATLPIYRYLHPVIPFVYLLAVEMLVWMVSKVISDQWSVTRKKSPITSHQSLVTAICIILLFFFIAGQTSGKIFLDSRYVRAHTNQDKPPVYVKLSWILKENTKPGDLVITNLDAWGSWYGQRRTIWYPLEPSQLIPSAGKDLKIDAIYLTSYKIDDENYYMGESWRSMFYNPEKLEDKFFADNFKFAGKFKIEPEETYEKEGATAVLLIKNEKVH